MTNKVYQVYYYYRNDIWIYLFSILFKYHLLKMIDKVYQTYYYYRNDIWIYLFSILFKYHLFKMIDRISKKKCKNTGDSSRNIV